MSGAVRAVLILGIVVALGSCGRVYYGDATPVQAAGTRLPAVKLGIVQVRGDSVDVVIPVEGEAAEAEDVAGCFLPSERGDAPAGGRPQRPRVTPSGGSVIVVRTTLDSLPALARHPFALAPVDTLAPQLVRVDTALARLRGDSIPEVRCRESAFTDQSAYLLTVDSAMQGAVLAAGGALLVVAFLTLAGSF